VTAIGNTACPIVLCLSTKTAADLAASGQITRAVLVWSGVSSAGDRDQVKLTLPSDEVIDVSADDLLSDYSPTYTSPTAYTAYADVTQFVTTEGTYAVSALRTSVTGYGGWSLIVLTHDETQPLRSLMIATPLAHVTPSAPYSLLLDGVATATSDVHLVASAFEGTSGLLGSLSLNGLQLTDPFRGLLAPGVDLVDVTAADIGAGSGTLAVSTTNDAFMLAGIGLAIDLS
jgi:hypothetical protein